MLGANRDAIATPPTSRLHPCLRLSRSLSLSIHPSVSFSSPRDAATAAAFLVNLAQRRLAAPLGNRFRLSIYLSRSVAKTARRGGREETGRSDVSHPSTRTRNIRRSRAARIPRGTTDGSSRMHVNGGGGGGRGGEEKRATRGPMFISWAVTSYQSNGAACDFSQEISVCLIEIPHPIRRFRASA